MALALKQTWSQLFRARSLMYWQRSGIGLQQINLAVLVQPLTNAIASGKLTYDLAKFEIQASWGLGMASTRGEVLPDSYQIQPEIGAVRKTKSEPQVSRQLGNKTLAYSLWTLSEAEESETAQLYLTQVSTQRPAAWLLPTQHSVRSIKHSIQGLAPGAGQVVAPAHVILNSSHKPETLPPGVILVAPAIAPDWLPLLQQAAGVVTEQGRLTCHGAILARELGIPAVVSAANATHLIQTGESVLVDGDRGEIHRVSEEDGEKRVEEIFLEKRSRERIVQQDYLYVHSPPASPAPPAPPTPERSLFLTEEAEGLREHSRRGERRKIALCHVVGSPWIYSWRKRKICALERGSPL